MSLPPKWSGLRTTPLTGATADSRFGIQKNRRDSYFTNFAFTHKGVRLIALDWASRLPASEGIWTSLAICTILKGEFSILRARVDNSWVGETQLCTVHDAHSNDGGIIQHRADGCF